MRKWLTRTLKRSWPVALVTAAGLALPLAAQADYSAHPQVKAFIDEMVRDHQFDRAGLEALLRQAEKKQAILDAISRPAEKSKTWAEYRKIFIVPARITAGVEFWRANAEALARAEQTYGVPAEMIVAIIGVETNYGRNKGSYRVVDALSTLAFDYPPRSPFFRSELKNFLLLTREQQQNPLALQGSYAGAMGYGQFMPSSYRHYAVDFDGDGLTDIWNNTTDAIGSVANYFRKHGWQPGEPVVARAELGATYNATLANKELKASSTVAELRAAGFAPAADFPDDASAGLILLLAGEQGNEFWIGRANFFAITRYNHSRMYAMAAYDLSQAIAAEMN